MRGDEPEIISDNEILNDLISLLKRKILVIPEREEEFLNPVLREEEWIFGYKFIKLLNFRMKKNYESFREKRRAALLDDNNK